MDDRFQPPSPAPSPDEFGLRQLEGSSPAAPFARVGPTTRKAAGSVPQSYAYYGSSPAYHGPEDLGNGTPTYSLQPEREQMTPHGDALGFDTATAAYGPPLSRNHGYPYPRPYGTPETPPELAARATSPRTRSSVRLSRAAELESIHTKGSRVKKPAPKKKRQRDDAPKREKRVQKSLSELAIDNPDVAVADINAYVHRSKAVRLQEVAQGKVPGKIKRPMNAFMLYRKTYQHLAKFICTQNNHQVVSQVCGDAWPLEPVAVKDQFTEWARVERENHQNAHPNYKFTPSKPTKKAAKKQVVHDDESDNGSVLADPDWVPGRPSQAPVDKGHGRHGQVSVPGSTPMSFFDAHHLYGPQNVGLSPPPNESMYQCSNPGKPIPTAYDSAGLAAGQYYQQSVYPSPGRGGGVVDVMIRKTPSPATYGRGGQVTQEAYHDLPSQYPPMPHHAGPEQIIDPSLMAGQEGVPYDGLYAGFGFGEDARWPAQQGMSSDTRPLGLQDSMASLDDVLAQDPQLGYLRGDEGSWQVEEPGGHQQQFDTWPV